MGVTRLSCCCFVPFTPGFGRQLQSGVKTAAPLAENSSHRLGQCTQGNPALATVGEGPHQIWLSDVLSQSFSSVSTDLAVSKTSSQRCTISRYPQAAVQSMALGKSRQLRGAVRRCVGRYGAQGREVPPQYVCARTSPRELPLLLAEVAFGSNTKSW